MNMNRIDPRAFLVILAAAALLLPALLKAFPSLVPILIVLAALAYARKTHPGIRDLFDSLIHKNGPMNGNIPPIRNAKLAEFAGGLRKKTAFLLAAVAVAWLLLASVKVIEAGRTGVYSLFGVVSDREVRSGIHLINPLARVHEMSIRTESYTMSKVSQEGNRVGDDAILTLTKEGLSVELDITVLYHLNEESASDIYREVGPDYAEKIIRPEIRSVIREAIAQYEAKDIYSEKRQEAATVIRERLAEKLGERGIVVEDVLLRNVNLPTDLARSIQEKLQAEQESQKYDFVLEKERKEADRKRIEAEGQRDAQATISESLTPNYLEYLYIRELKDREGTIYVPTSPDSGLPLFRNVQ